MTPATAPEALRGTAFAQGVPGSVVEVFGALIGAPVRVLTPRADVTGIVLGLGSRPEVVREAAVDVQLVSLLTAEGTVVEVILTPGTSVDIPDNVVAPLSDAVRNLSHSETQRSFDLKLAATDPREIEISYVTEAPAWKNSWRLMLEEKRLQGWATFENTSGADWAGIDVILSTGTPVAYRRDLLTPLRIGRAMSPALMQERPTSGPTEASQPKCPWRKNRNHLRTWRWRMPRVSRHRSLAQHSKLPCARGSAISVTRYHNP